MSKKPSAPTTAEYEIEVSASWPAYRLVAFPDDGDIVLSEAAVIEVAGVFTAPKSFAGRVFDDITLRGSRGLPEAIRANARLKSAIVGTFQWGAGKQLVIEVPADMMAFIFAQLNAGSCRLVFIADAPLRGTVLVRSFHIETLDSLVDGEDAVA